MTKQKVLKKAVPKANYKELYTANSKLHIVTCDSLPNSLYSACKYFLNSIPVLRIRLSRVGRPNQPRYRIVVTEHTSPAKSSYLEVLGNYLPTETPKKLVLDLDRYHHWVKQGAKPTDTVAALVKRAS